MEHPDTSYGRFRSPVHDFQISGIAEKTVSPTGSQFPDNAQQREYRRGVYEIEAQLEQGLPKYFPFAQEQRNQQTAVAIQKRMDGLELHVGRSSLEECRGRFRMVAQEQLQFSHTLHNLLVRWGTKAALPGGCRRSNFEIREIRPASDYPQSLGKQYGMHLLYQTQRARKPFGQPRKVMVQDCHIVAHLPDIIRRHTGRHVRFKKKKVGER